MTMGEIDFYGVATACTFITNNNACGKEKQLYDISYAFNKNNNDKNPFLQNPSFSFNSHNSQPLLVNVDLAFANFSFNYQLKAQLKQTGKLET